MTKTDFSTSIWTSYWIDN